MNKLICFFILFVCASVQAQFRPATSGGGGAPNVVSIAPGTDLSTYNWQNNTAYQLGSGTYSITPSMLNSNLLAGNTFLGIKLLSKTNLTILGVPGLSVIDGSSAPGECFWVSNCSNIKLDGFTVIGWTNHNFTQYPLNSGTLWAAINYFKSENLTFSRLFLWRHADHGIQDKGGESSGQPGAHTGLSTNRIEVVDCAFEDIGSLRSAASSDGTCITGGSVRAERNSFLNILRAFEPYDENEATGQRFYGSIFRNNRVRNYADGAVLSAGSTNGQNVSIIGNTFENDFSWSWHGTNWGFGGAPPRGQCIYNSSGRYWTISGNTIMGFHNLGISVYGVASDCLIENNSMWFLTNNVGVSAGGVLITIATNTVIRNNYIRDPSGACIYFDGARDTLVEGNVLLNPGSGYGVQMNSFTGTSSNNIIRNNRIIASNTGVWDQNAGALLWTYVFNNEIVAPTKVGNSSGDFMQVEGPPRVFNYTNDFPSIAAGGSFRTNFPAIGAKTNDFGYIMTPDQFYRIGTNIMVQGWASNDTFWVWVQNTGPAAADPGSVRFKAVVRQVEAY